MSLLLAIALVAAAPVTNPSQITFTGNAGTRRALADKLADVVSVKDYGAPCNGLGDDALATASAIAALPSSGGVVDARSCYSMTIGSTLTIGKAAVTLLLPAATISMGANQIIVAVGAHNVALVGAVPYGGSVASATVGNGTFLAYTGTTQAIKVGDSTADTYGFRWADITLGLTTAGSAAIGIQLNRAISYTLDRPRVHGFLSANTQAAIDLEGFTNFTGGRIADPYLWNGNVGILYGQNANANIVSGGVILNNVSGGVCHKFNGDGAGGVGAHGNAVFGGDCEPLTGTAFYFDTASTNFIFGAHVEAATLLINATAHSGGNVAWLTNSVVSAITDLGAAGTVNSFVTSANTTLGGKLWELKNQTDATSTFSLYAGLTTGQIIDIGFKKWDGTLPWKIRKDASENFEIVNNSTGVNRIQFTGTTTNLNSESTNAVTANLAANSGTGGFIVGSGGASPTQVLTVDSVGRLKQSGLSFSNLSTPANGTIVYCSDCTIANPCAGVGTGAFAKRLNGVWVCN